jgi:hypothetical protein
MALNAAHGAAALGLPGGFPAMMAQQANGSSGANPTLPTGPEAGGVGTEMNAYMQQMYAMYANLSASLMIKPGEGPSIQPDAIGLMVAPPAGIDALQGEAPAATEEQPEDDVKAEAVKDKGGEA